MSDERLDRLERIVEANALAIQQANESMNFLVTEFIRPSLQQAFANFERLERIEIAIEANTLQIREVKELAEINQRQIAANTENITRLETKVDEVIETVRSQSQQIQILIEDNRADRQAQREALAAIISVDRRVGVLEQRAS